MGCRCLRLRLAKGFMLPTGLAIVAVSDKALQARKTTLPRTASCRSTT